MSMSVYSLRSSVDRRHVPVDPEDGVAFLGSKDSGMAVISVPHSDPDIVDLLDHLNIALQKEGVRDQLDRLVSGDDESVRLIQAGRYELFLCASGKESKAFDQIAHDMPDDTKRRILTYAVSAARRDPRLKGGSTYEFGNFSIICNYDPVPAQAPHIDLILPNYQFGLIITDKIPGTQFLEIGEERIRTTDALAGLWSSIGAKFGQTLPPNLAIALQADSIVRELIASFGDVLLPLESFGAMTACASVSTGTLLSLPGSVIHAGPMSNSFRAIMFFSARPGGSKSDAYDPDTQFSGVTLCGHIVHLLWRQPNIAYDERLFLLSIFEQYISASPVSDTHEHFTDGDFSGFIKSIERSEYPKGVPRDEYIKSLARNKKFCPPRPQFVENERIKTVVDISGSKLVSVNDLVTKWKGQLYDVAVYRKRDGTVFLHYPGIKDPETGHACFEGADDGDRFTLTMNSSSPAGELFDGSNGLLCDTWQKSIRCFRRPGNNGNSLTNKSGSMVPSSTRVSKRLKSSAKKKNPYTHLEQRSESHSGGKSSDAPTCANGVKNCNTGAVSCVSGEE